MKNQKNTNNNSNSVVPLIIIVVVLAGFIGGGYWLYSSSRGAGNVNRAALNANTARTPTPPVNAPPGATPPNTLGSPAASVTVEEFADFQCGACASAHPMMKDLVSTYGNRIKFVFRNFPLQIPAHDKAFEAALAAEAAGLQGKFWVMQDQLFNNQQAWTNSQNYRQLWADYAANIGLDVEKFRADMESMAVRNRVEQDRSRGNALGVGSTPTIYVNGRLVPYSDLNVGALRQIVDAELQRAAATQSQGANQGQQANTGGAPASGANNSTK